MLNVNIEMLPHAVATPLYATEGASGADLYAAIRDWDYISPGATLIVPTGIKIALPPGYEAQIRPRSGLAAKHGITVLNTPGTIDEDYRGEIGVILINHNSFAFKVARGDRIAQMVIAPTIKASFTVVQTLDTTARGEGKYGSTGVR